MINKLKTMNESLITIYKNQPAELRRQELNKTILEEPEAFLKMSIETAYKVLEDLGISPLDIPKIYSELIDAQNIDELQN